MLVFGGTDGGRGEREGTYSCGDDKSHAPVDGHDGGPEVFALLAGEGRGFEELGEDVVVEDFDADVAVEGGGDQGRDHGEDVGAGLPVVGAHALVGGVHHVLALVAVHEQSVEHVEEVDECLSAGKSQYVGTVWISMNYLTPTWP